MGFSTLVLGADGGGTKTVGLLADHGGVVLAQAQVGGSNQNVVGPEAAAANLAQLIIQCCQTAGRSTTEIGAVTLGLAGAGTVHEREALVAAINAGVRHSGGSSLSIAIETDARIALEGAFAGGPGVVVIAGTGSIVIGKTPAGSIRRVGGWGRVLGDEGSGYFIGLEALRAITEDFDERRSAGLLRETLCSKFGWTTREELITSVYRGKLDIPSLAPYVLDGAAAGDPTAAGILRKGATLLAEQVAATVRSLGVSEETGVVFIGSLIDHETPYAPVLRTAISVSCPRVDVRLPLHPPAYGAVLMAIARRKEV